MRREDATRSEAALWQELKARRCGGVKFRRQHVLAATYIVDFVALGERLVVEVDGGVHQEPGHAEADARRQAVIESLGFRVLRIEAAVVEGNVKRAVGMVRAALRAWDLHPGW